MTASVKHDVPISKDILAASFNNRVIGVAFKKEQAIVKEYLKKLGEEEPEECQKMIDAMTANGSVEVGPLRMEAHTPSLQIWSLTSLQ